MQAIPRPHRHLMPTGRALAEAMDFIVQAPTDLSLSKTQRIQSRSGPVVITNRGAPAHVLLTWEAYQRLAGHDDKTILEALALPGVEDVDFDPPRLDDPSQPALLN